MIEDYSPEKVSQICDISETMIIDLAEYLASIKPMTLVAGYGMQRYTNSGQTIRAMIALNAITGNIGKPGAGWQYANLQSHIFDQVKDPLACYPPETNNDKIRISVSTAKLGKDILETRDPKIKMIWVERGNPITQNPETHTVLKAFRSADFRVVIDQFLTDTAREADIVLPAKTFVEQADIINAYWHPYIQYKQKILEPPGEVKPETEIYYLLAENLGMKKKELEDRIPSPGDKSIDAFLRNRIKDIQDLDFEKIQEGPVLPPGHEEIAFADLKFNTPSGKIELLSNEAKTRWGLDDLPDFTYPEQIKTNSDDLFYFLTPNTKNRIHSQFNNLLLLKSVSPEPIAAINPQDALNKNIKPGDKIRIYNDRGEILIKADIDHGIKSGCISVTNGWWVKEGGTVNFTSAGRETDMGHGAAFHNNLVKIERVK